LIKIMTNEEKRAATGRLCGVQVNQVFLHECGLFGCQRHLPIYVPKHQSWHFSLARHAKQSKDEPRFAYRI
jgi:hypothetical protein